MRFCDFFKYPKITIILLLPIMTQHNLSLKATLKYNKYMRKLFSGSSIGQRKTMVFDIRNHIR